MRAFIVLLALVGLLTPTLAAVCPNNGNPDPFYQYQCLSWGLPSSACSCPTGSCSLGSRANKYCKQTCSLDKENFTCVRNRISVCDCPSGMTCTTVSAGYSTCQYPNGVCPTYTPLTGPCDGGPPTQVCTCPPGYECNGSPFGSPQCYSVED